MSTQKEFWEWVIWLLTVNSNFMGPDPSSNLTQIQEVSDWILKAKLPLSIADLRKKLDELKDLAANLPNSTAVLKEAEPQLDMARKLLQDAQDTRW